MLQFLRKHQRLFFLFITVVIVISFTFFGNLPGTGKEEKVVDQPIGKAIDGSTLYQSDRDTLIRFLATGVQERGVWREGEMPNLLNDGVISRDFLSTGLGVMLAEKYWKELQPEFQVRLEKAKRYKPYAHPQVPFLQAEAIWQHFLPQLPMHLAALKQKTAEPTVEAFSHLCFLYLDQGTFPPDLLKRFLTSQQSQYNWAQPDPQMNNERLALFGFQSMEDWFGRRFQEIVAEFIHDAAIIAEQRGYHVSKDEVRADLLQNATQGLQTLMQKEKITPAEVATYYKQEIHYLGLHEEMVLKAWRKVLLARRLFQDAGQGTFLDRLSSEQFASYAQETASVDLYQLPEALRLRDFRSLLKLQLYLEAATPAKQRSGLQLPRSMLSVEEVEKRAPELVQHRFQLEYSAFNKESLTQKISLKETWDWELDDAHWSQLTKEFPLLAKVKSVQRADRFAFLEKLDSKTRLAIDSYAREKIIEKHTDWIAEGLEKAAPQKKEVVLRSGGGNFPFAGIEDRAAFLNLLHATASQKNEEKRLIKQFSEDEVHFYRIRLLPTPPVKETLSFADAQRDGTLDALLDKRLEESYDEIRKKDPIVFQNEKGAWKLLAEVKDQVGAKLYAPLLKMIEEDYRKRTGKEPLQTLEFYAAHRLYAHMCEAKKHLEKEPENAAWVITSAAAIPLDKQWHLIKTARDVKRGEKLSFAKEEMFQGAVGRWSAVAAPAHGDIAFYHLHQRSLPKEATPAGMERAHELLALDARHYLMETLLNKRSK